MTHRLVLLAVFLFQTSISFAQTTLVSSMSEFNSAIENVGPGDTIALSNGVWTDADLQFYAEGTAENPIVLTAETAGEVMITGTSRLRIYGTYLEVRNLDFKNGSLLNQDIISFRKDSDELAENCRLTNCRILNYNPTTNSIAYKWVSIFGKNNRVDHCHFGGKNHEGALLVVWLNGSANYHRIDHNYFSDISTLGRNGGETIRIGTSTNSMTESRTIVENNLFEACDGEIEIISNKSGFNIYRYNTFRNNDGMLTLRHGNDCEVYNNFFFGGPNKSSGGVRIIGERHKVYNNYFQDLRGTGYRSAISMMNGVPDSPLNRYFQVKNAEVVHNTFVSCAQPFSIGEGKSDELSLPPLDCIIANNVSDKSTGTYPIDYNDTPINMSYYSNYIYSSQSSVTDPGIINADPELVLVGDLWRAEQSSVITDAATGVFNYVISDMDGQSRTNVFDIGSDEVSDLEITNKPLTTDDVGYNWEDDGSVGLNDYQSIPVNFAVLNDRLHISNLPNMHFPYNMTIYNIQGQKMQEHTLNVSDVSVSILNLQGIYIIKILGEGKVYNTTKMIF